MDSIRQKIDSNTKNIRIMMCKQDIQIPFNTSHEFQLDIYATDLEQTKKQKLFPLQRDKVLTIMVNKIMEGSSDGNPNFEIFLAAVHWPN